MIQLARVAAKHPNAYKPDGCKYATIISIFLDTVNERLAVGLLFDNGKTDWIPLSEVINGHYRLLEVK